MGRPDVTFKLPPQGGPYEFVFNNALGGLWFVTALLFMLSLYFLVRRLQHRSLSSSRHQFAKYALSAQAIFSVALLATCIYEMIRTSLPREDLVVFAVVIAPSFFGAIGWASIL
jgi:hypothetical protein